MSSLETVAEAGFLQAKCTPGNFTALTQVLIVIICTHKDYFYKC